MKRFILFLVLAIATQMVYSHPPKKITTDFDKNTSILKIIIEHDTPNGEKHHIDEIKIERNGQELLLQKISNQVDLKEQKAIYFISDIKQGDELKITAHCNVYGKKTETLKI